MERFSIALTVRTGAFRKQHHGLLLFDFASNEAARCGPRTIWTVLHSFDGEHWTAQTNDTTNDLYSIHGSSDGRSLWAVRSW